MSAAERLDAGTIVDGRYRVLERLGTGGMADVYCAEDLQLGRKVALKLLHERFAADDEFVERFRREASSAAGLQHPNVVSVYDRGEVDGTAYIAMEYVEGKTLKQVIVDEAPLDPARAIELVIQVLRAARFAHRRGIIHRDLKPHNVMLDSEGRAKVTDFGIAKAGASDMTQTGSIMGTAQYLSPEQAQGLPVSAASDLYSIGILLYELLAGRVPFEGDSAVSIALKQVNELPVPPSRYSGAVTPALDAVVMRALEKDPARRFSDADEFVGALERARDGLDSGDTGVWQGPLTGGYPPPAPPTGGYDQTGYYPEQAYRPEDPRETDRRRWIAIGIAALVIVVLIGGAILLSGGDDKKSVPSVLNTQVTVAQQVLSRQGFKTTVVRKQSDSAPDNTVLQQDPGAGAKAKKGSTITLTASSGPGTTQIPDVTDQGQNAATQQLEDAGFKVEVRSRTSSAHAKDHVISTVPAARSVQQKGLTVTLVVSSGPANVTVPGVVGQSLDDAQAALEDQGFKVVQPVTQQESTDADPGTVLAQAPAPQASAAKGSSVTLTVAKKPAKVDIPDVTGMSQGKARDALEAKGFKVRATNTTTDDPGSDGKVVSESPSGRAVMAGATITIKIGNYLGDTTTTPSSTTPSQTPTTPAAPPGTP